LASPEGRAAPAVPGFYTEAHNLNLDQLAIAGGAGVEFLDQLDRDIQRWQRNARTNGYIQ
jgi:hypothetical protein